MPIIDTNVNVPAIMYHEAQLASTSSNTPQAVGQTFTEFVDQQRSNLNQINHLRNLIVVIDLTPQETRVAQTTNALTEKTDELTNLRERITRNPPGNGWVFNLFHLAFNMPITGSLGFGLGCGFAAALGGGILLPVILTVIFATIPIFVLLSLNAEDRSRNRLLIQRKENEIQEATTNFNSAAEALENARGEKRNQETINNTLNTSIERIQNEMATQLGIERSKIAHIATQLLNPEACVETILLNNSEIAQRACFAQKLP